MYCRILNTQCSWFRLESNFGSCVLAPYCEHKWDTPADGACAILENKRMLEEIKQQNAEILSLLRERQK